MCQTHTAGPCWHAASACLKMETSQKPLAQRLLMPSIYHQDMITANSCWYIEYVCQNVCIGVCLCSRVCHISFGSVCFYTAWFVISIFYHWYQVATSYILSVNFPATKKRFSLNKQFWVYTETSAWAVSKYYGNAGYFKILKVWFSILYWTQTLLSLFNWYGNVVQCCVQHKPTEVKSLQEEQAAEQRQMVSESGGRNIAGLVQRSNTSAPAWEYFGYNSNDKGEPANMINLCALFASRKLWLKRVTHQTSPLATSWGPLELKQELLREGWLFPLYLLFYWP